MNEILSQFSINPVALLAHIVNFILVFIIIYKVLLKKMFVYIEDQKKEIEQGIALKFDFEKKNTEFEIHSFNIIYS